MFKVYEGGGFGRNMFDPANCDVIWEHRADGDNGRGLAADIDPRYEGYEMWDAQGHIIWDVDGNTIANEYPPCNMAAWWDGDLLRELVDERASLVKWDYSRNSTNSIISASSYDCTGASSNTNKPPLVADIIGDWREEIVLRRTDNSAVYIFTTAVPTTNRIYTLMHDPQYRNQVSGQNIAYQQSSTPSFYLGEGMDPPPRPNIFTPTL